MLILSLMELPIFYGQPLNPHFTFFMNPKLLVAAFALFLFSFRSFAQSFNTQDSLALVDLYNATNGPGWVNHTNWLTSKPVYTWYGVATQDSVRVSFQYIALPAG